MGAQGYVIVDSEVLVRLRRAARTSTNSREYQPLTILAPERMPTVGAYELLVIVASKNADCLTAIGRQPLVILAPKRILTAGMH